MDPTLRNNSPAQQILLFLVTVTLLGAPCIYCADIDVLLEFKYVLNRLLVRAGQLFHHPNGECLNFCLPFRAQRETPHGRPHALKELGALTNGFNFTLSREKSNRQATGLTLSSWSAANASHMCAWPGVGCDASGRVIILNLCVHFKSYCLQCHLPN